MDLTMYLIYIFFTRQKCTSVLLHSGGFDFNFKNFKAPESSHPKTKEVVKKSASTIRRNAARKKKLLDEKNKIYSSQGQGETAVNSKHTADSFNYDNCDLKSNCEVSLRKHMSKNHKKPVAHERFK